MYLKYKPETQLNKHDGIKLKKKVLLDLRFMIKAKGITSHKASKNSTQLGKVSTSLFRYQKRNSGLLCALSS